MSFSSNRTASRFFVPFALGAASLAAVLLVAPVLYGAEEEGRIGEVIATIGGEPVHRTELEDAAAEQLDEIEIQRLQCEVQAAQNEHNVLNDTATRIVNSKLLELQAEVKDTTARGLRMKMRESAGEVTDEDIDQWWEANKARVRQPREEVEDQIRSLLLRQKLQTLETAYFETLRDEWDVEMLIGPFRLDVRDEGFASFGPADAKVTIVEFSDFECPYCKRVLPTVNRIKQEYPDDVRFVFRQYPLDMHANAHKAAEASLCAEEQGKFWEMHDLMFTEQEDLGVNELKDKAGRLGLDASAFNECLDSGRYSEEVSTDLREGSVAGVTGTPAMFVNGRLVSGAVGFEQLAEIIDDEIGRRAR